MKLTKLKIKNLFGIKEVSLDGTNKEILGDNGTGKTSIIDAIRYALKNASNRDYIVREGETEGEVIIETDTGLMINRKSRKEKADYKSVKSQGKEIQSPEAFLRDIFTELQLNPIEFINMPKNEQNRIILDMIEFDWDMEWIKKQFGEIPPDPELNWDQNILAVLFDIQKDDGYYFLKRQDITRDARNKTAFIAEIGAELPTAYCGDKWKDANLAEIYKEIETIRQKNSRIEKAKATIETKDNKVRSFDADRQISISSIEKAVNAERESLEKDNIRLEDLIKANKTRLKALTGEQQAKIQSVEETYRANIAEFDALVKEYEDVADKETTDLTKLTANAKNTEDMKSHINEYDRMVVLQKDVEKLQEDSEELTVKIEHARELPGIILETANIPIDHLTVKEGIPLINGLPISNLSEGEKLTLCIDVAMQNQAGLNILLLDGIETLSKHNRIHLYDRLKEKGVQFISTRTTESDELMICELE